MSEPTDDHPMVEAGAVVIGLILAGLGRGLWVSARGAWRHPWLTAGLLATVVVWAGAGALGAFLFWSLLAAIFGLWWSSWPAGFEAWVVVRARSSWRRVWVYRRRWRSVMALTGLWARLDGEELVPPLDGRLGGARSTRWVDVVSVRLVVGQQPEFWELRADALAHSFGAQACKVTSPRPGRVVLRFRHRDRLEQIVPAMPIPEVEDVVLGSVAVGLTEDGEQCRVPVFDAPHLLVVGCSQSGKSGLVEEVLCGLAPVIHSGLLEVWAIDPKGGMELGPFRPLFTEFARPTLNESGDPDFGSAVELLENAVRVMLTRADQCWASGRRRHTPTTTDPALLVIVDEIARITRYEVDKNLAYRAKQAIAVLLSQGAAPAVSLLAATQDGRLDTVPRDLFPARVAMRLAEAQHVDMVLGDGARARSALCDKIPDDLKGVGYLMVDGQQEPIRFRAGHVTDEVIADVTTRYPAPCHHDVIDAESTDTTDITDEQDVAA